MLCLPQVQEFLIVCLRASNSILDLAARQASAGKKAEMGNGSRCNRCWRSVAATAIGMCQ